MSLADAVNAPSELREETVEANLSQQVHLVGSIGLPRPNARSGWFDYSTYSRDGARPT